MRAMPVHVDDAEMPMWVLAVFACGLRETVNDIVHLLFFLWSSQTEWASGHTQQLFGQLPLAAGFAPMHRVVSVSVSVSVRAWLAFLSCNSAINMIAHHSSSLSLQQSRQPCQLWNPSGKVSPSLLRHRSHMVQQCPRCGILGDRNRIATTNMASIMLNTLNDQPRPDEYCPLKHLYIRALFDEVTLSLNK